MVRNGQQVARVYTSAGGRSGDQASIAVRRQRVRFGAASNQYLLYRNIVRGMYRTGKSTKQSDYNFFVRENVDLLPYLTREENAAGVKCAMPGTFSRGTLGSLIYSLSVTAGQSANLIYALKTPIMFDNAIVSDEATVAQFKAALRAAFPNARKVTFAICSIVKQEVSLPNGSSWTHSFDRDDLVFDLYEADPVVSDESQLVAYIQRYVRNAAFASAANEGDLRFLDGYNLLTINSDDEETMAGLNNLYILAFATNDQVGDCYTSVLDSIVAPDSDGGLDLYATLRTDNHRQVAEDSYGYATGVMRTNIQQS
jgi:hypothetical protein